MNIHRTPLTVETIVLMGLLVLTFLVRLHYVFHYPFNEDELRAFHLSWQVSHGLLLWEEVKPLTTPLFSLLHVPFFWVFGDRISTLFLLRIASLCFFCLFLLVYYRVVQHLFSPRAGMYAVLFFSTFSYSFSKVAEFRPNSLMLLLVMLAWWIYLRRDTLHIPYAGAALAGVLLGISYNVYQEALLCFCAFGLHQVVLVLTRKRDTRRALASALAFFGAYLVTIGFFLLIPYSAVKLVYSLYVQFIVYAVTPDMGKGDPGIFYRTALHNALFFALCLLGLCVSHRAPFLRGTKNQEERLLLLLLLVFSLVRVTITKKVFEQYFLLGVSGLAMLLGYWITVYGRRLSSARTTYLRTFYSLLVPALVAATAYQGIHNHYRSYQRLESFSQQDLAWHAATFDQGGLGHSLSLTEVEDHLRRGNYTRPMILTQTLHQQKAFLHYCLTHLAMRARAFDGCSSYVFANDSPNFNPPDLTNMYPFLEFTYEFLQRRNSFLGVAPERFGTLYSARPPKSLDQALREDFERYPPDLIVYDPWVRWLCLRFPSVFAFFNAGYRYAFVSEFNNVIGVAQTRLHDLLPMPLSSSDK